MAPGRLNFSEDSMSERSRSLIYMVKEPDKRSCDHVSMRAELLVGES